MDKSRDLRDINFWLKGFRETTVYDDLEWNLANVHGIVGGGPVALFPRTLSNIIQVGRTKYFGRFDLVIKVDLKQAPTRRYLDIKQKLAMIVAEELGLLDQEYSRLKEENDELRYYSYGLEDGVPSSLKDHIESIVPQIFRNLSTKRYFLVVHNLYEPIEPSAFTEKVGLPPPSWNDSSWLLISTTTQDVHDKSGPEYHHFGPGSFSEDKILMLTLSALHQAAKYIYSTICYKDEQYWHLVTLRCFHYVMLLFSQCSPPHGDEDQQSSNAPAAITSDELIRHWAAQGFLTIVDQRVQEGTKENNEFRSKYNEYDVYHAGNVILEAFREYSLLQLPFSPATNADEATKTAAHFLAYHRRIAESLTTDELRDDNPRLERMQWISLIGDQGWHVSREWLRQGTSGLTTLIVRHCSQQSRLFAKLDHFLAKLPCLCVLDLSYTPLESLHPYICYLQKLHLLSLRGCYNLTSPFSFPNTEATLSKNNSNKKINLLYLDLSYSNITAFQCDFFHSMPNLQELMLVKCSNLAELPASTVALSSLTTLELTGTQIKSFHWEGLNSLRSLKLIDNRKLLSLIGSMSKARGFIDQHTEGWESSVEEEITLEGHPTLRSFSLIDTPLIRRLSLRRCRKLEFVDIKEVGALEELDLSCTAIKDLPADIPNLPKLGKLLIMDVPSLRRFPWHELRRLPDVFCLAQCYRHGNQSNLPVDLNPQVAQVCINDSRLFHSFRRYNPSKKVFKSFYVRVTPCKTRITKMIDKENMVTTNKLKVLVSAYADVRCHYLSFVPLDVKSPFQETDRHVEISAVDRYPEGLRNLLEVTKSISMMYDTQVSCLNDLASLFEELEECKLLRCHRMVHVFQGRYGAGSLKNACVSHLKSLTHFYRVPAGAIIYDFGALKHLRLEHCPRLEGVMPRDSALPSLVTLDILFCYNLKAIFYDNDEHSPYQLPCLRRIRLQELPLLEHLRVGDDILIAPAWEELYVRGCWSLRHLPRLRQRPGKVKVSGERAWWAKLQWDDRDDDEAPPRRDSYEPRLPPAFASLRERVVIKTYLR